MSGRAAPASFAEVLVSIVLHGRADAITGDGSERSFAGCALTFLLWPGILSACICSTWLGFVAGSSALYFNIAYVMLAVGLFALERLLPHERAWLRNDGQIGPDLAHTLVNKGFAQVLIVVGVTIGIAEAAASKGGGFWPGEWPLLLQVVLGLLIAEAGLYTAHRVAH